MHCPSRTAPGWSRGQHGKGHTTHNLRAKHRTQRSYPKLQVHAEQMNEGRTAGSAALTGTVTQHILGEGVEEQA